MQAAQMAFCPHRALGKTHPVSFVQDIYTDCKSHCLSPFDEGASSQKATMAASHVGQNKSNLC